jgi:class 3 adenylate cyclase
VIEVLTFVFSDIEGSTALVQALGADRYGAVLVEHHRILAEAIAPHGGAVELIEGDGAFVIFRSPSAAAAAALDAQVAWEAHAWPMDEPLRVRMGMHTGEAERREGTLVGLAIHEAARISAAAHGGQILVSATTAGMVGNELPGGAALVDLGCFQLKDLPGDHRLIQLHHPNLAGGLRAPRVSQAARTNLSATRSAFIGRRAELDELHALVAEHHLVTIVGSGGAGKTRLALEVAHALVGTGFNGVWMVELAASDSADDLMAVIASTLGLPTGADPVAVVSRRLGDGAQLLVLDNCEHLLDSAARVAILLADASRRCGFLRRAANP